MPLIDRTFSQIITFTRTGTTATYFNSAGVLTTTVADEPRFDYDPATLLARGFLIEEARTNLLTYSQDLSNAVWTLTGQLPFGSGSIVDDGIAPDGTTTADKVVEDTSPGSHFINYPNITTSTTTTNSLSFFIKAAGRTSLSIRFGSQSIVNRMQANINLNTGAVSGVQNLGTATGATCTATLLPNQWWRITASVNPNDAAATAMRFIIYPNGTTSYTGDGTSGAYVWGAQLEAGAFPTSYIPTTTTALTRSADVASVNTLSPWFNSASGTLFVEGSTNVPTSSFSGAVQPALVSIDDGTNNNRLSMFYADSSGKAVFFRIVAAGAATNPTPANVSTTVNKAALAYAIGANQGGGSADGSVATLSSPAAIPVVTQMRIGSATTGQRSEYIRRITYYKRRLSNAQLQAITQ